MAALFTIADILNKNGKIKFPKKGQLYKESMIYSLAYSLL